jgi:predicted O-methyltransferase YrrM
MIRIIRRKQAEKDITPVNLMKMLSRVEGQITAHELHKLFSIAKSTVKGGVILEIGSYRGKSTLALAMGAKHSGARVYSIDPHEEFTGVAGGKYGPPDLARKIENIAKFQLGKIIFPICMNSHDVGKIWSKPIDVLWIDGDHSFEGVKGDYDLFSPFVKKNGLMLFHDSAMEGVKKTISMIDPVLFKKLFQIDSMTAFEKLI